MVCPASIIQVTLPTWVPVWPLSMSVLDVWSAWVVPSVRVPSPLSVLCPLQVVISPIP